MDFGFGRFLEMFEERFGRKPTTTLLALIGVTVVTFCVRLIWTQAVDPIVLMLPSLAAPSAEIVAGVFARAFTGVVIAILGAALVALIISWILYVVSGRNLSSSRDFLRLSQLHLILSLEQIYGLSGDDAIELHGRLRDAADEDELRQMIAKMTPLIEDRQTTASEAGSKAQSRQQ